MISRFMRTCSKDRATSTLTGAMSQNLTCTQHQGAAVAPGLPYTLWKLGLPLPLHEHGFSLCVSNLSHVGQP